MWDAISRAFDFLEHYNGAITALATVAIGLFTYFLVKVTNRQARFTRRLITLTGDQLKLARDEFNATHRPRLEIRFVQRVHSDVSKSLEEQLIAVAFRLENVGTGKCIVTGSNIALDFFSDGNLPQPDDVPGSNLLGNITLDVGAGWRHLVFARNNNIGSLVKVFEQGFQFLYL